MPTQLRIIIYDEKVNYRFRKDVSCRFRLKRQIVDPRPKDDELSSENSKDPQFSIRTSILNASFKEA